MNLPTLEWRVVDRGQRVIRGVPLGFRYDFLRVHQSRCLTLATRYSCQDIIDVTDLLR